MTPMEAELVAILQSQGHAVAETSTAGVFEFNGRLLNVAQLQDILSGSAPTDGPTLRELLKEHLGKDQP